MNFVGLRQISPLWYLLVGCVVVSMSLSMLGCREELAVPPSPPPTVTVVPVMEAQVNQVYEFVGRTVAVEAVDLLARVQGFLESRNFEEGGFINAHDVLFVIERAPYQAAVDRAAASLARTRASLNHARRDLNRLRVLHNKGDVSDADFDTVVSNELETQAQVKEAEAALRSAELDLGYTQIIAPISGRIGRATVSAGNLVGPDSGVLASIVKLDPIYVTFTVSERDLMTVRQQALEKKGAFPEKSEFVPRIKLSNGPIYEHQGQVGFVDNRVDERTGTVTVRATFPNPNKLLLPGQFVTVLVEREEPSIELLVPQASIQQDQAGKYVLIVNDQNRVDTRRVVVGEQYGGTDWVVKEGLEVGELIIFEGSQKVRPGVAVQPTTVTPSKPAEG